MTTLTAALTTTVMLLIALMYFELSKRSLCQASRWKQTVTTVGEGLKDQSMKSRSFSTCRGSQVSWHFKGRFYDQ